MKKIRKKNHNDPLARLFHDLRNLYTAALLYTELIRRERKTAERNESAKRAYEAVKKMIYITDEFERKNSKR